MLLYSSFEDILRVGYSYYLHICKIIAVLLMFLGSMGFR